MRASNESRERHTHRERGDERERRDREERSASHGRIFIDHD